MYGPTIHNTDTKGPLGIINRGKQGNITGQTDTKDVPSLAYPLYNYVFKTRYDNNMAGMSSCRKVIENKDKKRKLKHADAKV